MENTVRRSIVICLVIVDCLHHEEIWKEWISESTSVGCEYSADLIIHAKYPEKIKSNWVKMRTLEKSFRPEWNSVEVVRAMMALLEKAVQDKHCGRIVFGTG